jgi:hypothetical protein
VTVLGQDALISDVLLLGFGYSLENHLFLGNKKRKRKKQHIISRSSTEAEYRVMASTSCKLTWITSFLKDYHVFNTQASLLFCDNRDALYIVASHAFHEYTKHIELDCHLVRDKIQQDTLHTMHITSQFNLDDIFTKAFGSIFFFYNLLAKMNVLDIICSEHPS